MYTRNLLWLVSLGSAAPLYAADVPANTPLAPQQVFRYNNHSDPGTLDPQKVEENTAAQIVLDLFEGLVWMDGEGQVQPAQAERWEILDGGKRYIFHLRSGLQWSDGQPLTAEDFVNKSAMNGTILAHTDGNVPNLMVRVPEQNEFYLGELFYMYEFACGVSGYILGVNPFNQPGVESYKKNMFALLGKPGYEDMTEALLKRL